MIDKSIKMLSGPSSDYSDYQISLIFGQKHGFEIQSGFCHDGELDVDWIGGWIDRWMEVGRKCLESGSGSGSGSAGCMMYAVRMHLFVKKRGTVHRR